jgi:hypothetical protein
MMPASADAYLRQWLSTAGTFSVDLAWQTDRMQIRCKCGAILRISQPTTTEIPWLLQDWVSTHGHNGSHGADKPTSIEGAIVPLTADFKHVADPDGIFHRTSAGTLLVGTSAPSAPPKSKTARIVKGRRFR